MSQSAKQSLLLVGALGVLAALALLQTINQFIVLLLLVAILLLRLVQGLATARSRPAVARPQSGLWLNIAAALLLAIGGLPLFGAAGLAVFVVASPVFNLVFGARALDDLPMYGGLSVIFLINVTWPASLVLAYLLAYRVYVRASTRTQALIYAGVLYASALVCSFGAYLLVASNR